MSLELDHVFVNVSKDFPEKKYLDQNLPIGGRTQHKGQGTEVEFLAFDKNYLEFIWVNDESKSAKNALNLQKKFIKGQCPFGIAFRGAPSEEQKLHFWKYEPSYLSRGCIWVHKTHNIDNSLPMIFIIDFGVDNELMWPSKKEKLKSIGILPGEFNQVTVNGPVSSSDIEFPGLILKRSDSYSIEIAGVGDIDLSSLNIYTK